MKLKHRLIAICLIIVLLLLFSGCAKTGRCDGCGKEAALHRLSIPKLIDPDSPTQWLCKDCYETMNEAIKMITEAFIQNSSN